jgi:UDP-4-amino-4,6-dideoxy-N-acetyl-beta-L-altrosamine N-acetyltransferase
MSETPEVTLQFLDVATLDDERLMQVLAIRNQPGVRQNMYTDHVISAEEHLVWRDRLRTATDARFFAVVHDGDVVGGVGISALNRLHRRAEWAFYLSRSCQGRGIGSALERQFVTKAFDEFGIEKLNCEVIAFNGPVVRMHEKFGFRQEGIRRDHVIREGRKYDTVLLGITKDEWRARQ